MWLASIAVAFAEAPPPLPPDARFALALYCNPTCDSAVMDALEKALEPIAAKNGFPDEATKPMRVMGLAGTEFGMPDADYISAYGVGVDRPDALVKSQQVLLAWFAGPRDLSLTTLKIAHDAFADAAARGGGWVEDLDTQRLYGAEAWKQLDPNGKITDWFVVDGDPQDEAKPDGDVRLVTRGLRRYGDFELVVENVDPAEAGDVSFVLNALAEAVHGKGELASRVPVKNSVLRGTATFSNITGRDGDPEAPLLRVRYDGDVTFPAADVADAAPPSDGSSTIAPDAQEAPIAPAAPVAPPTPEAPAAPIAPAAPAAPVAPAAPPAPAAPLAASPAFAPDSAPPPRSVEEAHAHAVQRLESVVHPAWNAGLPPGAAVAVSVPFPTRRGGQEYMWIELRSWTDTEMTGVLMNDPWDVPDLKKGDTVSLKPDDVFDYVWKRGDGTREGNTTAAFVRR